MLNTRILVVQNDMALARKTRYLLQCAMYDVPVPVFCGDETLRTTESCRPDLVLIDIKKNDVSDGINTARDITSRCHVPVLCLVEDGDLEFLEQERAVEPIVYLRKPYEEWELMTSIKTALGYHATFFPKKKEQRLEREEHWG